MITIEQSATNQVDLTIRGAISREDMQDGLEQLLAKSKDIKGGRMLYRIENFKMPDWSALAIEMRYLPRLFTLLPRFDRVAVLTDEDWIATAAKIEGALLPGIEIRTFAFSEGAAAQAWLEGGDNGP